MTESVLRWSLSSRQEDLRLNLDVLGGKSVLYMNEASVSLDGSLPASEGNIWTEQLINRGDLCFSHARHLF